MNRVEEKDVERGWDMYCNGNQWLSYLAENQIYVCGKECKLEYHYIHNTSIVDNKIGENNFHIEKN